MPRAFAPRSSATPPPGTIPSSAAARPQRVPLLLHLRLGRRPHLNDGRAARELGEPFLQRIASAGLGGARPWSWSCQFNHGRRHA
jgi:hypothetical protein